MCQKAVGSVAWPFVTALAAGVVWTRGAPTMYRSSEAAERGFCAACGTPLSFQTIGADTIDLSIGSLDDPSAAEPDRQYYVESRVPWFDRMHGLPAQQRSATPDEVERRRSYQRPDHDTQQWQSK
jgi:hypothetical protein